MRRVTIDILGGVGGIVHSDPSIDPLDPLGVFPQNSIILGGGHFLGSDHQATFRCRVSEVLHQNVSWVQRLANGYREIPKYRVSMHELQQALRFGTLDFG